MKKLTNTLMRGLVALTVAGLCLAVTPISARADVLAFEVDESAVPGADDEQFDAEGLTGKYLEELTLNADGSFSASLVVQFTAYTATLPIEDQIGAIVGGTGETTDPNLYGLYALVTVEGSYFTIDPLDTTAGPDPGEGTLTQFIFSPTSATADVYTDPSRDTEFDHTGPTANDDNLDDQHILTASSILPFPDSNGLVLTVNANNAVVTGSYALVFTNPTLVDPDGPLYWPGLTGFTLTGTASGDVDPTGECAPNCVFPTSVIGDTSLSFEGEQIVVPEPTTLSLLGLGLLGVATAARRRRKV